jgi:hypothetical protein
MVEVSQKERAVRLIHFAETMRKTFECQFTFIDLGPKSGDTIFLLCFLEQSIENGCMKEYIHCDRAAWMTGSRTGGTMAGDISEVCGEGYI